MKINKIKCPECQGKAYHDNGYIKEYVCTCSECGNKFTIKK